MFKLFILISLISTPLFSKSRVEIFAKSVVAKDNSTIEATGDVLVLYDNSIIKVNRALFNRSKSSLFLDGDVELIGDGNNRLYSNSLTIDISSRDISINNIFLGGDDNLWIDPLKS